MPLLVIASFGLVSLVAVAVFFAGGFLVKVSNSMFIKHFVRMLTREELSDEDVIVYFDIVQSVVPTKLLTAYDDEKSKVGVEVMAYTSEDDEGDMFIYEIILEDEIDSEEGDKISDQLFEEFPDIKFTFEASVEV